MRLSNAAAPQARRRPPLKNATARRRYDTRPPSTAPPDGQSAVDPLTTKDQRVIVPVQRLEPQPFGLPVLSRGQLCQVALRRVAYSPTSWGDETSHLGKTRERIGNSPTCDQVKPFELADEVAGVRVLDGQVRQLQDLGGSGDEGYLLSRAIYG
jgi:hypothetical protein